MRRIRGFVATALAGCAIVASAHLGVAQDYPNRTIVWTVPSSAGSGFDVVARVVTDKLAKVLGQPVVVENLAGAGGTVGAATVAEATPDGYTILQININHTAGEALYKTKSYDLIEDFVPVIRFISSFHAFVVPPSSEATTMEEFLAMAKAKPGEINYASAGIGSATFMVTELLKSQAGIDLTHIPYEGGGPALSSVVAGETDFYGAPYSTAKPFIDAGTVRALAVTSAERASFLPDLPATSETVPGFEFVSWYGLMLPAGTPVEIRDRLYEAMVETLADPDVEQRLADLGFGPLIEGPDEFAAFLKKDVEVMKTLVEASGIEPK